MQLDFDLQVQSSLEQVVVVVFRIGIPQVLGDQPDIALVIAKRKTVADLCIDPSEAVYAVAIGPANR